MGIHRRSEYAWLLLAIASLIVSDAAEPEACSTETPGTSERSCEQASGDETPLIQTRHPSFNGERRASLSAECGGGSKPCPVKKRPNILYINADQWRWDWAGFHNIGMEHLMPNLRELAKSGTRFNYAYAPSALCTPSRCAFAQGVHLENSFVQNNGADCLVPDDMTYLHVLQQAGYSVMISGKDHLSGNRGVGPDGSFMAAALGYTKQGWRTGDKYEIVNMSGQADDPYALHLLNTSAEMWRAQSTCYGQAGHGDCCTDGTYGCDSESPIASSEIPLCGFHCPVPDPVDEKESIDEWTERNAEKLVEDHMRAKPGTPWYMSVGFPSPHPPFILSPSENKSVSDLELSKPTGNTRIPEENVNDTRRQYAGVVMRVDRLIGKLVAFLRERDIFDNTLVIVSADHGEHAGDWGEYGKMSSMEPSIRVPLVVTGPGVRAAREVDEPVETLDMVATMLDYAGTEPTLLMDTKSLKPFLTGAHAEPPRKQVATSIGTTVEGAFFYSVIQKFPTHDTTFKLVCCYMAGTIGGGCLKQGPFLPAAENQTTPAVTLMSTNDETPGDIENLLQRPQRDRPCVEAREMMEAVPSTYRRICDPILSQACPRAAR